MQFNKVLQTRESPVNKHDTTLKNMEMHNMTIKFCSTWKKGCNRWHEMIIKVLLKLLRVCGSWKYFYGVKILVKIKIHLNAHGELNDAEFTTCHDIENLIKDLRRTGWFIQISIRNHFTLKFWLEKIKNFHEWINDDLYRTRLKVYKILRTFYSVGRSEHLHLSS